MADEQVNGSDDKHTVGRGPSYPFIDLKRAVERIEQMAAKGAERAKMPPETFYKFWGYKAKSSGARQTMAAVYSYGLVEYVGRGRERRVQLTDLARRIVLDRRPNSPERAQALATAALEPPIFAELWEHYGPLLPDPDVMTSWLTIDRGFNQQGADVAVANFISTIEYTHLDKPADRPHKDHSQPDADNVEYGGARVGDMIDWEADGVLCNESRLRVRAISEDEAWVFVDGSETGIPMEQVIVKERVKEGAATVQPPTLPINQAGDSRPQKGSLRFSPDLINGPLDVAFDRKMVVVQGRSGSPEELDEFIEALKELKEILERSATKKNRFLTALDKEEEGEAGSETS